MQIHISIASISPQLLHMSNLYISAKAKTVVFSVYHFSLQAHFLCGVSFSPFKLNSSAMQSAQLPLWHRGSCHWTKDWSHQSSCTSTIWRRLMVTDIFDCFLHASLIGCFAQASFFACSRNRITLLNVLCNSSTLHATLFLITFSLLSLTLIISHLLSTFVFCDANLALFFPSP